MIKASIGELKLSPIKDDGMFIFYNDFITINGKVAKGDKINIYVESYEQAGGKHIIKPGKAAKAEITVRGDVHQVTNEQGLLTVEDFYQSVSETYKNYFYFGKK